MTPAIENHRAAAEDHRAAVEKHRALLTEIEFAFADYGVQVGGNEFATAEMVPAIRNWSIGSRLTS